MVDLFISYKLYKVNGFTFNVEEAYEEIVRYNHTLFSSLINNKDFFFEILKDIELILLDKNFKTNFKIYLSDIDKYMYFNIIAKSMHFVDLETVKNELFLVDGMIHRTIVINNINYYSKSLGILFNTKDISKNAIKLIMTLSKSLTWIKILIKEKGGLKTNFYLKFNIISNYDYKNRVTIDYSTIPFKYTEQYLIGASYLSICNFIKKSNWQLSKNKINVDATIKLSQQPLFIDFNSWEEYRSIIIDEISKKYKIGINKNNTLADILSEMILRKFEQNDLISKINNKIDLRYKQILNKNKQEQTENLDEVNTIPTKNLKTNTYNTQAYKINFIKSNSSEKELENFNKLIHKFYKTYEEFTFVDRDYIRNIHNSDSWELSQNLLEKFTSLNNKLNGDIQKLYYLIVAENAVNINYPIFIAHYYDFRGRIYPKSALGFTYMKAIRSLFYIPSNRIDENRLKNSLYFNKIINLKIDLDAYDTHNPIHKYYLIIHFLELGKLDKSKLLQIQECISLQNFVDLGIQIFNNKNALKYKLEDYIYARNLIKNIELYLCSGVFNDITIIRDSTASFLQHWTLKLGLNLIYLDKLNLSGYLWYDTYTFIITSFLSYYPIYKEISEFKSILNRKILKNMIMITNYNAGENRCFINLSLILEEEGIKIPKNELKLFTKDFWKFLRYQLFDQIFLNSKQKFLQNLGLSIHCDDNSSINLTYLQNEIIKEDIKFKEQRWVINKILLTNEIDTRQTKTALNANIIQASDAELCRYLITKLDISTVHDSFAINLFNVYQLMDETNLFFKNKTNLDIYAIFIII